MNNVKYFTIFSILILLVTLSLCIREIFILKSELQDALESYKKAKEQAIKLKKEYDKNLEEIINQKEKEYEEMFDYVKTRLEEYKKVADSMRLNENADSGDRLKKIVKQELTFHPANNKPEVESYVENLMREELSDLNNLAENDREKIRKAVRAVLIEYEVKKLYEGLIRYAKTTLERLTKELSLNEQQAKSIWIVLEHQAQDILNLQLNLKNNQPEYNKKLAERRKLTGIQIKLLLNDEQKDAFNKIASREGWN